MNDQIYYNATINTLDSKRSVTDALAVRDGKVVATGEFEQMHATWRLHGRDFETVDLNGGTVVPGFNDSHCHLVEAGESLDEPNLSGLDESDIVDHIGDYANAVPRHLPLICRGWDYESVPSPNIDTLDRAFPARSVILFHRSGHAAWFNQAAMVEFGIHNDHTKKNDLWNIKLDSAGNPIGIVEEPYECPAVKRILAIRQRDEEHVRKALERITSAYLGVGITSVQDNTWYPDLYALYQRHIRGMSVSCWAYGLNQNSLPEMLENRVSPDNFRIGPVKFFVDGAIGSGTAWLWQPYEGSSDNCGYGLSSAEIVKRVEPYALEGHQLAFHSIGDRAVSEICDALEILRRRYPKIVESRTRIEHAVLIREEDYPRLKDLGVVISAQPISAGDFFRDVRVLGPERAMRVCPHRSLLQWGIPLAFGSDFPFECGYKPLEALKVISRRPSPERIDPIDVLAGYCTGSAFAENREHRKGSDLEPGKDADFAVLSQNPLFTGVLPEDPTLLATYHRGVQVHAGVMAG